MKYNKRFIIILYILISIIFNLFGCYNKVFSPDYLDKMKKRVVKITSVRKQDNLNPVSEVGAGIIISIKKNPVYIITASHVVYNGAADSIIVEFFDQSKFEGKLTKIDSTIDLAVIEIDTTGKRPQINPKPLIVEKKWNVKSNDSIYIVGNPLGNPWLHATGNIKSANTDYIYFDVEKEFNVGYSGGALIKDKNQLVGMIQSMKTKGYPIALNINIILDKLNTLGIRHELIKNDNSPPKIYKVKIASIKGDKICIEATVTNNKKFNQVDLYYRLRGNMKYELESMEKDIRFENSYVCCINSVKHKNIECYIIAMDDFENIRFWKNGTEPAVFIINNSIDRKKLLYPAIGLAGVGMVIKLLFDFIYREKALPLPPSPPR